ncbi:FtsX-like permease family protein, partial [bacterium]|nr:FtsX-like permease family protein [bacterium]
ILLECNNVSAEFVIIGIVTTDINGGMLVFAGNETMNTVFGINYSNINFIQTDRELTSTVLNSFRKQYSALGIGVFDYEQFFEYDTHVYIQLMEFLNIFSKVLTVIVMAMVFLANYFNYLNEKENYLKLRLMGLNRKEQLKYGLIELALIMVVSYVVALGVSYLLFAILKQSALLLSAYIIKMPVLKNISFFTVAIAALMVIFNFMVYFSNKKENFNPILRKHW